MQLSSFLRTVLRLDAASCLLMAGLMLGMRGGLSDLLGLPPILLTEAGVALALVGLFILWLGTRERAAPMLAWLVVLGNCSWVISSFVALTMVPAVTGLGLAAVIGQAVAVLVFAALEWHGIRSSLAVPAR